MEMLAYCEGKGVRVLYVRHARHPFPAQWCSIKTAHAGGDTMEKYQAIRRKTMFKKGLSIIVFLSYLLYLSSLDNRKYYLKSRALAFLALYGYCSFVFSDDTTAGILY